MLNNLLLMAEAQTDITQLIFPVVLIVLFIGMMIFSSRSQKKRQEKVQNMIDSLKKGDKIKTIGGFIGIIVEVCDDNAFIIETGSSTMKSYMKIDKSAIYASAEAESAKADAPKEEVYDETVKEEEVNE
ncbi:MAG: preprotein translocase subunit YajC [Clostridia bacterium]|nr:preprotein translocase subunit YajC [Clostridia bacterium]MBR2160239.1 preprotein translocase subunit YajC [Clostridia bacterium]MBR2323898.1 preprotein translocase subunit YajC [Clostridia bacterium]